MFPYFYKFGFVLSGSFRLMRDMMNLIEGSPFLSFPWSFSSRLRAVALLRASVKAGHGVRLECRGLFKRGLM